MSCRGRVESVIVIKSSDFLSMCNPFNVESVVHWFVVIQHWFVRWLLWT
jgi:hypothetical protein